MVRLRPPLLTVATLVAVLAASGCGRTDAPTTFYVEDRWSWEEIVVIRAATEEWNDLALSRLRHPTRLLEYGGTTRGRFRENVFADGAHVVYRIGSAEECPSAFKPDELAGYATMQDLLIFSYNTCEGGPFYAECLYSVVLHEFGHFLGMPHFENRQGVMNPYVNYNGLTPADIDQFCIAYECD